MSCLLGPAWLLKGLLFFGVGVIKGALLLVPVAVVVVAPAVYTVVTCAPRVVAHSFYAAAATRRIATDLKLYALCMLPLAFVVASTLGAIGLAACVLGIGFLYPVATTLGSAVQDLSDVFLTDYAGVLEWRTCLEAARDVGTGYPRCVADFHDSLSWTYAPYFGEPVRIPWATVPRLLNGLLVALVTGVAAATTMTFLALVKSISVAAQILRWNLDLLCEMGVQPWLWALLLPWIASLPLQPVLCVLWYVANVLACFLYIGPVAGARAFFERTFSAAWIRGVEEAYSMLYHLNEFACDDLWSTVPIPAPRERHSETVSGHVGVVADAHVVVVVHESVVDPFWKDYATRLETCTRALLDRGWIPVDDLESAEGYLFIGLPAYETFETIVEAGSGDLCAAQRASATERLRHMSTRVLAEDKGYGASADPRRLVSGYSSLRVTDAERKYMACHLALCGHERVPNLVEIPRDPLRAAQLHAFSAAVQSIGTAVSRKSRFKALAAGLLRARGSVVRVDVEPETTVPETVPGTTLPLELLPGDGRHDVRDVT